MKEKLIIRNFGPIKNVELELGRFNILIGENATGKSTVAKVLAVCRYFSYIIGDTAYAQQRVMNSFYEGLENWGLDGYVSEDSYIYYDCRHYSLTVKQKLISANNQFDISVFYPSLEKKSQEFKSLIDDLKSISPILNSSDDFSFVGWSPPPSFYQNNVARVMDNPFYLPTERGLQSIFSLGKTSIQNLSDSLFNQFAKLDFISRQKEYIYPTSIEPLNIQYFNADGEGFIRKNNDSVFFKLKNAASGYQSTIPVVLLVKYYHEIRRKPKTFIIEEPELNLFPTAQNNLMKYLVYQINKYGSTLFANTHSPYVLASLNNLMYAYQLGQMNQEKVSEIIDQKYWLNPNDVSCYRMLDDGKTKNIIDDELKQIDVGEIDTISRSINEDYDKMSDIKYGK